MSAAAISSALLYVGWDEHMMFATPIVLPMSLDTRFEDLVHTTLPSLYGEHPDFKLIDWSKAQWFQGDRLFTPRMQATLAEQGFGHQSVLRFRTPGLEGLRGSCG